MWNFHPLFLSTWDFTVPSVPAHVTCISLPDVCPALGGVGPPYSTTFQTGCLLRLWWRSCFVLPGLLLSISVSPGQSLTVLVTGERFPGPCLGGHTDQCCWAPGTCLQPKMQSFFSRSSKGRAVLALLSVNCGEAPRCCHAEHMARLGHGLQQAAALPLLPCPRSGDRCVDQLTRGSLLQWWCAELLLLRLCGYWSLWAPGEGLRSSCVAHRHPSPEQWGGDEGKTGGNKYVNSPWVRVFLPLQNR